MSYKTIAAYLASPSSASAIIDTALPLAKSFEAHLIGIHLAASVPIPVTFGTQTPAELIEHYRQLLLDDSRKIEGIFASRTKGCTVQTEWRGPEEKTLRVGTVAAIEEQAVCVDLLVMGQDDGAMGVGELAGEVVLGVGRPVLVVPRKGTFGRIGERVAVAWDGSREAARAAFDALPLLKRAALVRVVSIKEKGKWLEEPGRRGEDLTHALARHGVKADAGQTELNGLSVGERLLMHAADLDCDLLVMGGYGHSRLRERVFGGATRHILENMVSPVLLSH